VKVRLILVELGAMVFGFALAHATTVPDGSMDSSVSCAPVVRTPPPPTSNYEQSSSMSEMCTAADPWKDKVNPSEKFVGSIKSR
jgi:hypothetical protein